MKKKLRMLIVIFVLSFVLSPVLSACNSNNSNNSNSNGNTFNITDEIKYPVQIPVGVNVNIDLNGDGTVESILYMLRETENMVKQSVSSFKINDTEYKDILYGEFGCYITNPNTRWYYIVDIDETDKFKEIAILDEGPSADSETCFFRYDGQNLSFIGSIPDFPHNATCRFYGDGTIVSTCRLNILQTWSAPVIWKLDEKGFVVKVHSNIYFPYTYISFSQNLLKDFLVYKKPELDSEQILIPAGSKITLVSTDNEHWVSLKTDGGIEAWFYMEDYINILIDGKRVDSRLIFDNLNFAD